MAKRAELQFLCPGVVVMNGVARPIKLTRPDTTSLPHVFTSGIYTDEPKEEHDFALLSYGGHKPSSVQQMNQTDVEDFVVKGQGVLLSTPCDNPERVRVSYLQSGEKGQTNSVKYGHLDVVCYFPITSRFTVFSDTQPGYRPDSEKEVKVGAEITPLDKRPIPQEFWAYYHSLCGMITPAPLKNKQKPRSGRNYHN